MASEQGRLYRSRLTKWFSEYHQTPEEKDLVVLVVVGTGRNVLAALQDVVTAAEPVFSRFSVLVATPSFAGARPLLTVFFPCSVLRQCFRPLHAVSELLLEQRHLLQTAPLVCVTACDDLDAMLWNHDVFGRDRPWLLVSQTAPQRQCSCVCVCVPDEPAQATIPCGGAAPETLGRAGSAAARGKIMKGRHVVVLAGGMREATRRRFCDVLQSALRNLHKPAAIAKSRPKSVWQVSCASRETLENVIAPFERPPELILVVHMVAEMRLDADKVAEEMDAAERVCHGNVPVRLVIVLFGELSSLLQMPNLLRAEYPHEDPLIKRFPSAEKWFKDPAVLRMKNVDEFSSADPHLENLARSLPLLPQVKR